MASYPQSSDSSAEIMAFTSHTILEDATCSKLGKGGELPEFIITHCFTAFTDLLSDVLSLVTILSKRFRNDSME